jgi:hypothetical protein
VPSQAGGEGTLGRGVSIALGLGGALVVAVDVIVITVFVHLVFLP